MIRLSLLPVSRAAATSALLVGLVGCNSDGALPVAADPKLDAQAAVPDGSVPKGDLGTSLTTGQPVLKDLLERLPASLELTFVAFALAVVVALPLGVLAATHPGSWIDSTCRAMPRITRRP